MIIPARTKFGYPHPFNYGQILMLVMLFCACLGLQAKEYGGLEQQRIEKNLSWKR